MPVFRYTAVSTAGEVVEGTAEARDRSDIAEKLHNAGLVPLRAEAGAVTGALRILNRELLVRRPFTRRILPLIIRELATLLQSGIPLDRSLEILADMATAPRSRNLLFDLIERIRGGAAFADAVAARPDAFPSSISSMVRAGEAAGNLGAVLDRIAETLERENRLHDEIRSALRYPMIVTAGCALSLVIVLTFVLPQFESLFSDARATLPGATRFLLGAGRIVEAYWWTMLGAVIALWIAARVAIAHPAGRRLRDGLLLRVPVFGDMATRFAVGRIARTLGMLLHNGVTLTAALAITKDTAGNLALAATLDDVARSVKEGKRLAEPLARSGLIPALAVHLVRIGEESARLDIMLLKLADIYEHDVRRAIDRSLALLLPGLTILVGLLVAGVIGSILIAVLSIYELAL